MKLCIAEKPSVAREIAFIIGAKSRKEGYFEGSGYQVTWTFGHFCTLKNPDDYKPDWKKWTLSALPLQPDKFEIKLLANRGVKKQFTIIKKLLRKATEVINCGDAGQEGELIQRWVLKQANYKGNVSRLWISSLTPEAIRNGFRNLRDATQFDNLYYAGFSRAIGDWLLGMNATRLYTLKYGGYKQVLSIGRVQTPTLAMLVDRQKEIDRFVPQQYWELHTSFKAVDFLCESGRFLKKTTAELWLQEVQGRPFEILDFSKKKGKELPPRLFDLTGLQVFCNKRYGYSADNTLKWVQSLYEKKVVTYPRVDTTYLPNDIYPKISGILAKMKQYASFTQPLLAKKIRKSTKVFNDKKVTDHHAIIPTGIEKNLPLTEQNIYDAIARRFIAAFYPDCLVANTIVVGGVEKSTHFNKRRETDQQDEKDPYPRHITFKATGKEILEEGWRVLFPKNHKKKELSKKTDASSGKNKEEEKILPRFTAGEKGEHQPYLAEKFTQPPKPYTEASLLRAMETAGKKMEDEELRELMKANGIGRPSTRANIIEMLFKRKYAQRNKKVILPTEMGIQLIDIIKSEQIKSASLTGQWEKHLRDIEKGTYSAKDFIANMRKMTNELVREVKAEENVVRLSTPGTKSKRQSVPGSVDRRKSQAKKTANKTSIANRVCPKCKTGKLVKGKTAYGCSNWKTGCTFRLPFSFMGKKIPILQLVRLLDYGATIQLRGFINEGKKIRGNLMLDETFELKLGKSVVGKKSHSKTPDTVNTSFRKDQEVCPKCNTGKIIKGKTAYGCSNWQEGCTFRYSFAEILKKAAGKSLSRELVWKLIRE